MTRQFFIYKIRFFLHIYKHFCPKFNASGCFNEILETIRKVRRVDAVRVDEECPTLLSDYLEKITGDIYLTLGEFCGENYVSVRRYYTDRDGNLRPRKEGVALTLGQFAILVDSMSEIESRYWAFEEGLSVSPFVQYVGPWKLSIDIFGNLSFWKHYYDQTKNLLMPLNKGISFPFSYYRQLVRREKSSTCWSVIRH